MSQGGGVRGVLSSSATGCAIYLGAMAALWWFLSSGPVLAGVRDDLRPWVTGAASLFLALGLGSFASLLLGYGRGQPSRAELMARARQGELPAEDGPVVVTGTVRALGAPLEAPLSGTPCTAYWYRMYERVFDHSLRRTVEQPVYWGYAGRPFGLDTAARRVRVMAIPNLLSLVQPLSGDLAVTRARAHRDRTAFVKATGLLGALGTAVTGVDDMLTSEHAEVRRDWRSDTDPRDPATLLLEEAVLPIGVTATVAGLWSTDRGAVVASSEGLGPQTVSATVGGPAALAGADVALPHSTTSYVVTAIVLTAIGAAIVWGARTYLAAP